MSHLQAAGLALAGYTLWVLCDVCLKFAGASNLPRLEVIALVGLAAAVLIVLGAAVRGEFRALWPRHPLPQALRSLLDLGNNLCVLIALQHMPLSMFYILIFLSPLVAAVLARVWLREALRWQQMFALLVGFAGVIVAVNPFGAAHQADRIGYGACLVCVACFSANMVWSRRMTQTESASSMTFFSGLVIALVAGVYTGRHAQPVSLRMTGAIAAIAFFGVLGNLCFFFALRAARTAYVSQFHYSQLPTGALIGFMIWRERPTLAMALGAILIVAAGMYTAAAAAETQQPVALSG
ncbi:DMT family transporter [Terriglobus sp.]|uniref:DMT family transporter n=1 Tax=Terriglobus sp. TaxID=1889013 RepID=UPI003AFF7A6C